MRDQRDNAHAYMRNFPFPDFREPKQFQVYCHVSFFVCAKFSTNFCMKHIQIRIGIYQSLVVCIREWVPKGCPAEVFEGNTPLRKMQTLNIFKRIMMKSLEKFQKKFWIYDFRKESLDEILKVSMYDFPKQSPEGLLKLEEFLRKFMEFLYVLGEVSAKMSWEVKEANCTEILKTFKKKNLK